MTSLPGASRAAAALVAVTLALTAPGRTQTPETSTPPAAGSLPPPAAPTSLLPEGFDAAPAAPVTSATLPETAPPPAAAPPPGAPVQVTTELPVDPFAEAATGLPIDAVGPLGIDVTGPGAGYGPAAFAGSDGRFLAALMRRIDPAGAPRWSHIVLRRALLTQAEAPADIPPADWIAERAWLLLRMGEVDGAKALVDTVPVDRFSRRLYLVAGQVHLAAADVPGLCPLGQTAASLSTDPLWRLGNAMCAAFDGDDITAASGFDRLRDERSVDPFDIRLAERLATISGNGGRAANIDWSEIDTLTPFRFGLAAAGGVKLPPELVAAMPAANSGWVARAPGASPEARAAALRPAAAQGIVSAQEMVGAVSAAAANADSAAFEASPAADLRRAYAAAATADRVAALRAIWATGDTEPEKYAAQIETALAAARIAPDAAYAKDAPAMIGALLSAGADRAAARWRGVAENADAASRNAAWGLLAGGAPDTADVSSSRFKDWYGAAQTADKTGARHRAALLLAGLGGLGRTAGGGWDGLRDDLGVTPVANSWTRAIDAAAAAGRSGEVAVLAAAALQHGWANVPAAHFEHVVAAYKRVGRELEARLLTAEAVMRG